MGQNLTVDKCHERSIENAETVIVGVAAVVIGVGYLISRFIG